MPLTISKYIFLTVLSLGVCQINIAQHIVESFNDKNAEPFLYREHENPLLWYNARLTKNQVGDFVNSNRFQFDTANYCRISNSKIKYLMIYESDSNGIDSALACRINYSRELLKQFAQKHYNVNIDSVKGDYVSRGILGYNSKIVVRDSDKKFIYKTDSLGRVCTYTLRYVGPFKRWIYNQIGLSCYTKYYYYFNHGNTILEVGSLPDIRDGSNNPSQLYTEYKFDNLRNLESITQYTEHQGKKKIIKTISYHYEYY